MPSRQPAGRRRYERLALRRGTGKMYALPSMVRTILAAVLLLSAATFALAQQPFLSSEQWVKLRDEASGAAPYENLRYLTRLHRVPATAEFDQAAQFVLQRAREYGLAEVQSEQFPIDGKTPVRPDAFLSGLDGRSRTTVGGAAAASAAGRLGDRPDPAG